MALEDVALAAGLAFWFLLPAYVANPMAVVSGGGTPMDFGRTLRDGRRLLGDGKTWRGFAGGRAGRCALRVLHIGIAVIFTPFLSIEGLTGLGGSIILLASRGLLG